MSIDLVSVKGILFRILALIYPNSRRPEYQKRKIKCEGCNADLECAECSEPQLELQPKYNQSTKRPFTLHFCTESCLNEWLHL